MADRLSHRAASGAVLNPKRELNPFLGIDVEKLRVRGEHRRHKALPAVCGAMSSRSAHGNGFPAQVFPDRNGSSVAQPR